MIQKGTRVLIAQKCPNTESSVGVSPQMEKMMGKSYIVDEMKDPFLAFIKNGRERWLWSIKDLKPVRIKRQTIKPELFNPENLIRKE